jgi:endonuclease/exonuclease/phosphatase family metal-dependent hydrolase
VRLGARLRRAALAAGALLLLLPALFVYNGLEGSWRTPESARADGDALAEPVRELRVMALNAAKPGLYAGGPFADPEEVRLELDALAAVIARERADLVFLTEVVLECGPRLPDQAAYLAAQGRFPFRAEGESYSFGLPFLRVRAGSALLSRLPLRPLALVQLAGGGSFANPSNNRRALWCELELGGAPLHAGCLRNDSFDLANNLRQTREILDFTGGRPALLAGDFNAGPGDAPLELLRSTGRFAGFADGPPTFPSTAPRRRIDHVLAPASWTLIEQHAVVAGSSDHLAVVAAFRLP